MVKEEPVQPEIISQMDQIHTKPLDNLFDDDDGEKMDIDMTESSAPVTFSHSDEKVMMQFYQRLYPFRHIFLWLNHSQLSSKDFSNREFAFTLQNDAYLRYQSFNSFEALKKDVLQKNPSRFEIGPVYSANPRDRKTLRKAMFKPLEKELVFDIDMTDYDDVRTCCSKTNICEKCWKWIIIAIRIIDTALREDFGFKHILWVYSGRRGAHAWVCDKRARIMDDQRRRTVANYLEVVRGTPQGKKVDLKRPLHPHISRSLDMLRTEFKSHILEDQDPWRNSQGTEKLLNLLPDRELNEALRKKWTAHPQRPSENKWADIDALAESGVSQALNTKALVAAKQDILLEYMYPRLDVEVSKHLNHLLKAPFCVHPGTGRICVPIDPNHLESFNPMAVPTVTQLLTEIDEFETGRGEEDKKVEDYEKTNLKSYVEFFSNFVVGILADEKRLKREREEGIVRLDF
ncbi:DNA primase small subunit [Neolecta irregularis DAH-3]|uniref:DNA primase n=1 Tax=Neolecta irregularis (strain DAH-3) TaxID=1198029 RepID=A0A1U7LTV9_NEOID|nr:DNA primase small subunit [Neolecta irregularis DAH-3]|eukprot:OLL25951.1 DNA primase small subunit [Neolecta irregularis DAH-3]